MWRSINKLFVFIFVGLVLANYVSAEQQGLGGTPQYQCVAIKQSFGNSTWQNISAITLPDKLTILVLNTNMQSLGQGLFNYTFCNTSIIGQYIVDGIGDVDGEKQSWTYDFFVSPLGQIQTTSQGIGSLGFLFLMVSLMLIFGFIGFRLFKNDTWWILGIFFTFLSILLLVYNTYLGFEYNRLFTGSQNSGVPEVIFYILLAVIVSGTLASIGLLFLQWKKVLKYIKKEVRRKEVDDQTTEDWDVDTWGGGQDYGKPTRVRR